MARRHDDFPIQIKRELANRVGLRCSRPDCPQVTSAPHSGGRKAINVGVAAHITSAQPGGPRYDASLTREQRRAIDNGIWLCQTCGTLVDADDSAHPVEMLREWKNAAELRRSQEVRGLGDEQQRQEKWRNSFAIVACTLGDGSIIRMAWRGPLEDLGTLPPRTVSADELPAIHCALSKHESEPVQPKWDYTNPFASPAAVWEVDERLKTKRKLRSPHMRNAQDFLVVLHRKDSPSWFCPRCGRIASGNNCSKCLGEVGDAPLRPCT